MSLELFWASGSPFAWRVQLALEFKQFPYSTTLLSFSDDEHKTPEFLAISPRAKVPVVRHEGYTLYESIAILQYLEALWPQPALFGRNAEDAGMIWQSIMETNNYIENPVFVFSRGIFFNRVNEQRREIINARETLETELERIDQTLRNSGYLVSDTLSAADICLYPLLQYMGRAATRDNSDDVAGKLSEFPENFTHIAAWNKTIEELRGYERTYPPHWK